MIEQQCSLTQISLTVMTRLLKNSGVPVSSPAAHRKGFNQEEIVKFLVVEEKKLKKSLTMIITVAVTSSLSHQCNYG